MREIDLGMMAGAGLDPRRGLFPPFWKADLEGLDTMLEKLEKYEESHGERFAPPTILKRLVNQGRLGLKSGQGFYAYPQTEDEGVVKLEKRDDGVAIAWLANPPMNAISPAVVERPRKGLGAGQGRRRGARRWSSTRRCRSCSRRAPTSRRSPRWTRPEKGAEMINDGHSLLRELETGQVVDDLGRQRDRLRRRLRALDGLRLPDRRGVGRLRPARDQPRDHPRLRRHPAPAAAGRPVQGPGDEPDRRRGPGEGGPRVSGSPTTSRRTTSCST